MSFKKMKAEDLLFVATDDLALDLPEGATKPLVLAALAEKGITWEQAIELSPTVEAFNEALLAKEEEERLAANEAAVITTTQVKETPSSVTTTIVEEVLPTAATVTASVIRPAKTLVKMVRENPTFQIRGYKFSQSHPYALVTQEDAEYLVENIEGFYYATPKEAAEFYG
jgi:hypothetical protein